MKHYVCFLLSFFSTTSFAQYSTYNANSHNQYNYNSGYTPPVIPYHLPYHAPYTSYTPSYTKPSYNSSTPSYNSNTPSYNSATSKNVSSYGGDDSKKGKPDTNIVSSSTYTPASSYFTSVDFTQEAKDWLAKFLDEPLTTEESEASLILAKQLFDLLKSAKQDFSGYRGKLKSKYHKMTEYEVKNIDFLNSIRSNLSYMGGFGPECLNIEFDDDPIHTNKEVIKRMELALLKQIPLMSTYSNVYIDQAISVSFRIVMWTNFFTCKLTINNEHLTSLEIF